ncbi:MAG: DUF2380 domain-containing protein, partial [Vicinamibacteria bacterium]|nr:DUF2380 domain-containing protein [Vicinamibacteria bacterium]
ETSHNRFGFTGHYWDKEASLYYAKARYYDPFTARFTQADSFLGNIDDPPSLHRYLYGAANPTMYWDPTGYDFRLNSAKKYGIDGVAAPELSGTVTASDLEKYQRYAGKYGTRADELQAISLSTTSYTKSWGKDIAKLWASSLAGLAGGEVVLARTMAGVTGAAAQGLRAMASRVLAAGTGGGVQQGTQSALDGKGVVEVTEDAAVGFGTGVAIGTGMEVIGAGWGAYKARQMMRDAPPRVDISPDDFARQAARRVDAAKARSTSAAYASTEAPAGSMTAAELEEQAALSSKDAAITDPARLLTAPKAPPRDHHIFPREFEKFFSARGIKIHDFTVTLDEATHLRALHGRGNMGQTPGRWNPTWRQFIDDNPNATALEIYQQGGKMMSEYGLTGMRIHPYKKP